MKIFLQLVFMLMFLVSLSAFAVAAEETQKSTTNEQNKSFESLEKDPTISPLIGLYTDCLTAANFTHYYISDQLFDPNEADKLCNSLVDKVSSAMIFMNFSAKEVEDFLAEIKQKTLDALNKEFEGRKKNLAPQAPEDSQTKADTI